MPESSQGTAARCEVCGHERCIMGLGIWPSNSAEWREAAEHWRLGFDRLKAENASLRESLRAAERRALRAEGARDVATEVFRAAEKRSTDLMVALRALVMAKDLRAAVQEERDTVLDGAAAQAAVRERVHEATVALTRAWSAARKLLQQARAALHDEERSAPQEGDK